MKWYDYAISSTAINLIIGWMLGVFTQILIQNRTIRLQRMEEQRKKKELLEEEENAKRLTESEQNIWEWCINNPSDRYITFFNQSEGEIRPYKTSVNKDMVYSSNRYKIQHDLEEMDAKGYIKLNTDNSAWVFGLLLNK